MKPAFPPTRLQYFAGRQDALVHHDEDALAARLRIDRRAGGADEVEVAVVSHHAVGALRAHDDDRLLGPHGQVQKVGGLLRGERAVRYDHGRQLGLGAERSVHRSTDLEPVVRREGVGTRSTDFLDLEPRVLRCLGDVLQDALEGRAPRRGIGNGAASRDDLHEGDRWRSSSEQPPTTLPRSGPRSGLV